MARMTGFVWQDEYLERLAKLSDQEVGRLVRALSEYHATGNEPELTGRESVAFDFIRDDIDRAEAAYKAKCDNNRRNRTSTNDDERERTSTNDDERPQNININNKDIKNNNKEKEKEKERADALNTRFESFWTSYPRHTAKQNALKAFAKLNPDDDLLSVMLQAIERQKKSSQWQGGEQFIPHPATWLNGKRWEDDVVTERQKPAPAAKTVTAQQYEQREYSKEYYAAEDKKRMQDLLERYGYLETEVQE